MVQEETKPILIQYINQRVMKRNKNFIMLFVGATGSGKSYSALRLAEMLDPTFTIDRVKFKAKDFMDCINDLVKRSEAGEEIKGRVILWDEFGVEHNAREFMTISNRVINYFFQTSRHLNLIVIMTVPLLSFIDSATRKLMHSVAEMCGINQREKTATVKVKMMQTNVMTGKEYPKYLRYKKDGKQRVSKKLKFKLPSKQLLADYENNKKAFTTKLNQEIMEKLLKKQNNNSVFTDTQNDYIALQKEYKGDVDKIAKLLSITPSNVRLHLRKARMREMREEQAIKAIPPHI